MSLLLALLSSGSSGSANIRYWYDDQWNLLTKQIKIYNGTAWVELTTAPKSYDGTTWS